MFSHESISLKVRLICCCNHSLGFIRALFQDSNKFKYHFSNSYLSVYRYPSSVF